MSNINESIEVSLQKIKDMIDVNTVVGDPITTPDGTTLIPVSKVAFGFASGGTDGNNIRFGAGVGAGVTITPIAFMIVNGSNVRMIYLDSPLNATAEKIIDLLPETVDKIGGFFKKNKENKKDKEESVY
ncbi:MAG: GerW family sporulation protein [Clostridia bacterium]|nr:GerW family sporulation protein [Clostridia bacterium]